MVKPQKIRNFSKKGLRFACKYDKIIHVAIPGVAQLVARLTGGQEAVSSSLATRTRTKNERTASDSLFLSCLMRFFLSFKIDCKTGCKFRPLLWLVGKTVKLESENFT